MHFKKGQVTIFIIIGIIILTALGIGIYIYTTKAIKPLEEAALPAIQKVPAEAQPIQDYITNCVESTAKTALHRIGDYGGYIDSSKFEYNPIEPTEGDAVQFSPDSDLIIPYWWHLKSPNDCTGKCEFSSNRPALRKSEGSPSIEEQVNEYINTHLKECLAGFPTLTAQGFEFTEKGTPKTETTIAKENIVIHVKYPIQAKKADKKFDLNEYAVSLELNLGEMYQLATEIINAQAENGILEHFTKELITGFSGLDKNQLPPTGEIDIKLGTGTIWVKYEVAQRIEEILTSYVPMLQVGNTRYYGYIYAPEKTATGEKIRDEKLFENIYNRNMLFTATNKTYPTLGIRFTYLPWWTPYFDLNCNDQACMPESITSTNIFVFGLQKYSFAYDLSYPVLVEMYDPTALKGEGYSLKFFIEANMRNNFPMPPIFEPMKTLAIITTSMLCDANQRTSGNITIKVLDSRTKKGIEGAMVGYRCGSESCSLGETINGTIKTQMPRCLGGQLSASHLDYQTSLLQFDVIDDKPAEATIELMPYTIVDFTAKKWLLKKGVEWSLDTTAPHNQDADENTLVIMRRKTESPDDVQFSVFAEICGRPGAQTPAACGTPQEDISKGIKIIPGKYEVKIYSFKYPKPKLVIPKDKRIIPLPWGRKEYYVPEEDIVFDETSPFPSGFAEFELEIKPEQLEHMNAIEIYYINIALDKLPESLRKIEDLSVMGKAKAYSQEYRKLLEPKYYRR
ncbi:MAG: hypothetical protein QW666_01740 [Candidatus Woesearchaeota archaeon]